MIYVSLSTIPQRVKNIKLSVDSLLKQTKKPDKIFINIPNKYKRFDEMVNDNQIPKFSDSRVEVTRCEDCGPGTKLLGSLDKLNKNSLLILADDDHIYEDYMIEKFYYFYSKAPNNAYSFYVHPLGNFGVGQGADGFAINTNHLDGIKIFYDKIVRNYKELFLYDDLWISYFLYFFRKNKILSLQEHLKKNDDKKRSLIYKTHIIASGLVSTYGRNLIEAVKKRDQIAFESIKYMSEKTKGLSF
jgi:GTPase SAR1 family protein